MGDSLADVVGSGMHIQLQGKDYILSRLNIGTLGEFEEYIKTKRVRQFLDISDGLDSGQVAQIVAEIQRTPVSAQDLVEEAQSMSGLQFVLYLSLRIRYPEITRQWVGDVIGFHNLEEMLERVPVILEGREAQDESPPTPAEEEPLTGALPSQS